GKCLEIFIKNMSDEILNLEIPAGQIFASKDSNVQDLVITQGRSLALGAQGQKRADFYAMCTQAKNMSPSQGEKFGIGEMAEPSLFRLVQKIDQGNYQNSTAQSAVWALSDREDVRYIYGEDTAMVREVAQIVSEERNIPMERFEFRPRRHEITSIKSSMEVLLENDLAAANLSLVDTEGNIIRTYFEARFYERGFHQWKVGASHSLGDGADLYLRLTEGDQLVYQKKVSISDSIPEMQELHSQAILNYEVSRDLRADIGVYDEENRLYFLIKEDHLIRKGIHRGQYIAKCLLPPNKKYAFKVITENKVLAAKEVQFEGAKARIYQKRSVEGKFYVKIEQPEENLQLAIYDAEGNLKRLLYKIHRMNPGNKVYSYRFEHRDGRGAKFYIRLSRKNGEVIKEKEIP
ncbi:MAG: hypothetical protein AAF696_38620, partial [Bacteroidota bacterium]